MKKALFLLGLVQSVHASEKVGAAVVLWNSYGEPSPNSSFIIPPKQQRTNESFRVKAEAQNHPIHLLFDAFFPLENIEHAQMVVDCEIDVNEPIGEDGRTLLHMVCSEEIVDLPAVEFLLKNGAKASVATTSGKKPVHFLSCFDKDQSTESKLNIHSSSDEECLLRHVKLHNAMRPLVKALKKHGLAWECVVRTSPDDSYYVEKETQEDYREWDFQAAQWLYGSKE